jgi:hypothetical protein
LDKYCIVGQTIDDNMARAHLHAGYLRLKIHTRRYVLLKAFAPQKFLYECTSISRYTYIACLVFLLQLNSIIMINNVCTLLHRSASYVLPKCGSTWPKHVGCIKPRFFSMVYFVLLLVFVAHYANYIRLLGTVKRKWKYS